MSTWRLRLWNEGLGDYVPWSVILTFDETFCLDGPSGGEQGLVFRRVAHASFYTPRGEWVSMEATEPRTLEGACFDGDIFRAPRHYFDHGDGYGGLVSTEGKGGGVADDHPYLGDEDEEGEESDPDEAVEVSIGDEESAILIGLAKLTNEWSVDTFAEALLADDEAGIYGRPEAEQADAIRAALEALAADHQALVKALGTYANLSRDLAVLETLPPNAFDILVHVPDRQTLRALASNPALPAAHFGTLAALYLDEFLANPAVALHAMTSPEPSFLGSREAMERWYQVFGMSPTG